MVEGSEAAEGSMPILMTSVTAISPTGVPDPALVEALKDIRARGNPVGVVSTHAKPDWFDACFAGSKVQFLASPRRQNGEVIRQNSERLGLAPHDVLVLAANSADVRMGKNGGAVLAAAAWSQDEAIRDLGLSVNSPAELAEVVALTAGWQGHWWYSAGGTSYSVRALADLSQYGKDITQQQFASKVTASVKGGGSRISALLAVTARSLLIDGIGNTRSLMWSVYPSSSSGNNDTEVLSDFTHRLRTTVSRVRFAQRGQPLFIRHRHSAKRSAGGGGDRTDPAEQLETIHLNPYYRQGRIEGRHVIVVDDCTTYGVSFGVAAALLKSAGATSMTGVALGKFGSQLRYYDIEVSGDPFAPLTPDKYKVNAKQIFTGHLSHAAQHSLLALIP